METRLKRFLSLVMAILMVVTLLPANNVFAEDDAAEGGNEPVVCTGQADCPAETHAEDCAKKLADEEAAKQQTNPPKPECTGLEDCVAEAHAEDCLKKLADDAAQQQTDLPKPECNGLADCVAEIHAETCEKKIADDKAAADKAAADAVAALIAALPTLEQLQAMPIEEQTPYYNQVQSVCSSYEQLTADQKALLPPAEEVFKPYFDYFNSLTQEADAIPSSCGIDGPHLYITNFEQTEHHHFIDIEYNRGVGVPLVFRDVDGSDRSVEYDENVTFEGVAKYNSDYGTVSVTSFGTGWIVYNNEYRVQVNGVLPNYAIYSKAERTVENYIERVSGTIGEQAVVYMMWEQNCQKPETIVAAIDTYSGENRIQCNAEIFDTYAKLTFTIPNCQMLFFTAESEENSQLGACRVFMPINGGGNDGQVGENGTHSCDNTSPHLFLKHAEHLFFFHEVKLNLGSGIPCYPFFRNANGEDIPLSFDDLTFTGVVQESTKMSYPGIEATTIGKGTIEYTLNGQTYALQVSAALPVYGIYLAPLRNLDSYITSFTGDVGTEKTVFLLWDPQAIPAASVTMSVEGSPYTNFTCEVGAGNLKITYTIPEEEWITFNVFDASGAQRYACSLQRNDAGGGKPDYLPQTVAKVNYKGETVTVGFSAPGNNVLLLNEMGGYRYTHNAYTEAGIRETLCLSAFVHFGDQAKEALAPQQFYDAIKNTVTFEFTSWENWTEDKTYVPSVTLSDMTVGGINTKAVQLFIEPLKLGDGMLAMHFTYDGVEYTTYRSIRYDNPDITLEIGENEDLNAILSHGGEHFLTWLAENYPSEAARYDGMGFVKLKLPAKQYTDVITVDLSFSDPRTAKLNSIQLIGQEGTQMAGLVVKAKLFYISGIDFVGNGSGDGIQYAPTEQNIADSLGEIRNCTFRNYGRAIAEVGFGHLRNIIECEIYDCDVGVHINNQKPVAGIAASDIGYRYTKFENCKTAVLITRLSGTISAFRTRISDCTFLFNETDFDLESLDLGNKNGDKATFYFERNYFGKNKNGNNDNAMRGPAKIAVKNNKIKVVTNPVRKTSGFGNEYWIYGGENQHSAIFNSGAGNILVDGESFNTPAANTRTTDSSAEIPISIVDDNGNEIAQWTF